MPLLRRTRRDSKAVGFVLHLAQAVKMKFDSLTNLGLNLINSCASGNTARQIGYIRRIIVLGLLDHNCVLNPRENNEAQRILYTGFRLMRPCRVFLRTYLSEKGAFEIPIPFPIPFPERYIE